MYEALRAFSLISFHQCCHAGRFTELLPASFTTSRLSCVLDGASVRDASVWVGEDCVRRATAVCRPCLSHVWQHDVQSWPNIGGRPSVA